MNHASHSRRQDNGKEQQMTDTSGPTSGRQFAYYDPDSQSWRMWPATGLWGSIAYSETWPRTGWMSGGRAFELPTLVPPTTGNDCSSSPHLPTPKANDFRDNNSPSEAARKDPALTAVSVYFPADDPVMPTPTASDATGGGQHPDRGKGHTRQLIDTVLGLTSDPTAPLFDAGSD